MTSRRTAGRRALALGAGALTAGALPQLVRSAAASAKGSEEAQILMGLIEVEQQAVVAYRAAAGGDLLESEVARAAELFTEQEQEHANALIAALEDRGGRPPKPPTAAEVDGLEEPGTQSEMLEFLIELENEAIRAFDDAAARLARADLLKTTAQIVSNEAQHLVVLRQQLGDDPVPDAFVTGA